MRLLKELHLSDPLYREMDRPKLTVHRMFQHSQHPGSSSVSSAASSRSPSMFSAKSFGSSVASGSSRKVWRRFILRLLVRRRWYQESLALWRSLDPTCASCPSPILLCQRCKHGFFRARRWLPSKFSLPGIMGKH